MKDFAGYLSRYLKQKGISYSNAAKMCGIDRTLLSRYGNGGRIPKKADAVKSLAKGLEMAEEEKRELLEAYRRTKVCREYHVGHSVMERILEGEHGLASALPPVPDAGGGSGRPGDDGVGRMGVLEEKGSVGGAKNLFLEGGAWARGAGSLLSIGEVLGAIGYILQGAAWVKLAASPQYPQFRETLQYLSPGLAETCGIEQVIGQQEWQHREGKLESLERLLPLLLQEKDYQVFHHPQWPAGAGWQGGKLDYAMTDKGMVLFAPGLEMGFFTSPGQPCTYYARLYEGWKSMCRPFARGGAGQYRQWESQPRDFVWENPKTGICFTKTEGENGIWIVRRSQGCAACIQEIGIVQLLEGFIWGIL